MARRKSSYTKTDYNENGNKSYSYLKNRKYYSAGGSPTEEQREYFEDDKGKTIGYRDGRSDARTQAWKELTNQYRYTPQGDQSWQVYRAKLMADNPGAEERERKRIEERNQRIHDANTRMWQGLARDNRYSPAGDQSWQVYRAKLMSETPGAYEREQKRIEEQNRKISEQNTKTWKDLTKQARYSQDGDQSWQVYRAKLMSENPGAYEREQRRTNEQNYKQLIREAAQAAGPATENWKEQYRNAKYSPAGDQSLRIYQEKLQHDNWTDSAEEWRQLQRDLTYGNYAGIKDPNAAYRLKQQGVKASEARKMLQDQADAVQAWEQKQRNLRDAYAKLGFAGYKKNAPEQESSAGYPITVKQYKENRRGIEEESARGLFDDLTDPTLVSWQALPGLNKEAKEKAREAASMADKAVKDFYAESPAAQAWENVFDFVEDFDQQNERNILSWDTTSEQEKANAQKTLDGLTGTAEERKKGIAEIAEENLRGLFDDMFFADATIEEQRETLYNNIMPDTYAERVAKLNPEQKAELDSLIDEALAQARNNDPGTMRDFEGRYENLNDARKAYEARSKAADEELASRTQQQEMQLKARGMDYDGVYKPELHPEAEYIQDDYMGVSKWEPKGTEKDKIYFWINNEPDENSSENARQEVKKYYFANDLQKETFNKYYEYDKDHGTDTAMAYIEALEPYLNARLSEYIDYGIRTQAEDPLQGTMLRAFSPLTNAAGGLMGTIGTGMAILGNESAKDKNSQWYQMSKVTSTTREHQNELLDQWAQDTLGLPEGYAKFAANVVDSMADNIFAMTVGNTLSGANVLRTEESVNKAMTIVQLIMSGEATSNTMIRQLENGRDPTEAALYAIGDGIIEWITERISLEAIMRPDMKEILKSGATKAAFLAKTTAAEGSEEINADLLNIGLDSILSMIYGHETELQERYNELVINQKMDPKEAQKKVLLDKLGEIGLSGLAGALSGFGLGAGRMVSNVFSNYGTGKNIQSVNSILDQNGMNQLLTNADQLGPDTESAKQAAKIRQQMDQGKKPGKIRTGKLAQTIQMESQEELEYLSEKKIERAEQLTDTLIGTSNLMQGYTQEGLDADTVGKTMATEDDLRKATGERTGSQREVVVTDSRQGTAQYGELVGSKVVKVENKETGNTELKTTFLVQMPGENKAREVESSDVKTLKFATAAMVRDQATMPGVYGSETFATMLQQTEKGNVQNIGRYMAEAWKIVIAADTDAEMPQTRLDTQAATDLFRAALKDHAERNNEWIRNNKANFKGKGQGTVTFGDGTVYGSPEFDKRIEKLDNTQKTRIKWLANWAQTYGIDLRFEDESTLKGKWSWGVHGSENASGITINLDSYDREIDAAAGKNKHHIVVTMGHEMTHWLQRNNMAGYNELKAFVMNSLRAEGKNIGARAEWIMNSYRLGGQQITLEDAIDEMVANACDQILGNPETVNYLKENEKGLFKKIRNFVSYLVKKFENIAYNMQESASYESGVLMKYGNELSKLWLGKANEILEGKVKQIETQQAEQSISRQSMAELTENYEQALEEKDNALMDRIVRAYAQKKGYTEDVYHGTDTFGYTEFNMKRNSGRVFVAYSEKLARSYTRNGQVQAISERYMGDVETMTPEQLLEQARKMWTQTAWGDKIDSIELLDNGKYRLHYFDTETNKQTKWDISRIEMEGRIRSMAQEAGQTEGVYHLYGKPGKQLVIDAEGAEANQIYVPETGRKMNTHQIADWAKKQGYDSVRINNVRNPGVKNESLRGDPELASKDVGIYFNPADLKSADAIVYDDNGKVIPLAERFDEKRTDIRWSMAEITNGIEIGMSDEQRYEVLKNATILAYNAEGKISQKELSKYNTKDKKVVVQNLIKLADKLNLTKKTYSNKYIKNLRAYFSKDSIDESVRHQNKGFGNLASLMSVFRRTFYNAVPIQIQGDRYYYVANDKSSLESYICLLGSFKYGNQVVPVKFEIKETKGNKNGKLYIVATINEDAIMAKGQLIKRGPMTTASSIISIQDVIKNVNKDDSKLLTIIPAQFLSQEQLIGKRAGLKESGEYIENKAINSRAKNNTPIKHKFVNMTEDRIDRAISEYGAENAYMTYINPTTFVSLNTNNRQQAKNESRPLNGAELREASETPFIRIDSTTGSIIESDGLERMQALAYAGAKRIAVIVVDNAAQTGNGRSVIKQLAVKGNNHSSTLSNLIPIDSQHRQDLIDKYASEKGNWFKYSMAEISREYEQAKEEGNSKKAREIVKQAAQAKGFYTDEYAFHGTTKFGFTTFDMQKSQNEIFVAFKSDVARTYTRFGEIRRIDSRITETDVENMFSDELADLAMDVIPQDKQGRVLYNIELNVEETEALGSEVFDLIWDDVTSDTPNTFVQTVTRSALESMVKANIEKNGIYRFYTRPGKQLVVDAKGHNWNDIPVEWDNSRTYKTREISKYARENGYDSVRINDVYDNGGRGIGVTDREAAHGDIGIFFNEEDVKSADPFTYDDTGELIPIEERFSDESKDIRWSMSETGNRELVNEDGETIMTVLPGNTVAASRLSYASWVEDDQRGKVMRAMKKLGYTEKQIEKYLKDIDSVAAIIAENRMRLDYKADRSQTFLKKNSDVYKYTLDASTLCAKRLLYQGTFNEIQKLLPNTALKPGELIDLANMMHEMGYQTPCGICYVESRRRNTGNAAQQFLANYHGDYIPNYSELTTTDGLAKLKEEHPQTYKDFIKAMNRRGVGSVKLVQTRTDYRGNVRRIGKNTVKYLNDIGGLRIQSFSDFETPHLIDMMQAVVDMSIKGLKGQAYTKVANFAWVFGGTGIKINLSLMGDVDENGNLTFDNREGMDIKDAMALRQAYSKNVGTILVGRNVKHILAAMADDRIDFIIPFHKSGWTQEDFAKMVTLQGYEDFQAWQNERTIEGYNKDGSPIYKNVKSNIDPLSYWKYELSGKENAQKYLDMCAEQGIVPKFNNFLVDNGDGSWSMQADGSTDGYWKLLIDFKMYDNDGVGAEQQVVKPNFNMEQARRVLSEYEGGANTLPVAQPVVERFVREYKAAHQERERFSMADESGDVNAWMQSITPSSLQSEGERQLLQAYRSLKMTISVTQEKIDNYQKKIRTLEAKAQLTSEERDELQIARNNLQTNQEKLERLQVEMFHVTSSEGYAGMMYKMRRLLADNIEGKTQAQVEAAVDSMRNEAERVAKQIAQNEKKLQQMAEDTAIKTIRAELARRGLKMTVDTLRGQYNTSMSRSEIEGRLAEIVLKELNGEDATAEIEALANDVASNQVGLGSAIAEEELGRVRGMTIEIGPGQQAELKATHSSLKEIRQRTKGSGVKFVYGTASTLDTDTQEIENMLPALRGQLDNEKDSLEAFVSYVEGLLKQKQGSAIDSGIDVDELGLFIRSMANLMLNEEAGGLTKSQLLEKIRKEEGAVGRALAAVQEARTSAESLVTEGRKAAGMASFMHRDVAAAIDYYNQIAKQAALVEKQKVRTGLIEELKSENTRKLIEQEQKYKDLIKNDKRARQLREDNEHLRKMITTDVSRLRKRLTEETDQKNIQEECKPLARFVTRLLVDGDLTGMRRVLFATEKQLADFQLRLQKMDAMGEEFDADRDLDWLVIHAPNAEDNDTSAKEKVIQDLIDIESGLMEYRSAEGKGNITLQDRHNGLAKAQEALSEILDAIQARGEAFINGQKWQVYELAEMMEQEMQKSRFKGEYRGKGYRTRNFMQKGITLGNMTPEYFFKNLKNRVMSMLHGEFKQAENRSGLLAYQAKQRLTQIAEEYKSKSWDGQEIHKIRVAGGGTVDITTEQLMSLYATWMRESSMLRPEETAHLLRGGFVLAENNQGDGKPRRVRMDTRPIRMNEETLAALESELTEEQKNYVRAIVEFMSTDLAKIGNEASLRMFGIKKYTETYYFPIKSWGGVLNQSSSNRGVNSTNDNRAARQSFTKRLTANAGNAIEIGDFTPTAMKHIVGMINYNTVAPAVENLNKVLNQQLEYGSKTEEEDDTYKRNVGASFKVAYGENAYEYLAKFMDDINGGVGRKMDVSLQEKLLSVFRKGAVAGSMSVAAQQPLSYIRAAMEISPKYLVQALSPTNWGRIHEELLKYSGLAVIKDMGRFDMNQGQSMIDFITPEGKTTKAQKAWTTFSDATTVMPEKMDALTWGRMWIAVKLEQAAMHPEMDVKSDAFLKMAAERFNDVMRRTQVYDSIMVKSQNMRSNNIGIKTMTSFMAEPTLSLNVLADAVQNAKEQGGMAKVGKAGATFLLSAAMQAMVKALMSSGRSPNKKKTWEEQFLTKWLSMFINEANPASLIPGYSDIIELLKKGELKDDALGVIGKFFTITKSTINWIGGKNDSNYRSFEDTVGQLAQLFTNIPLKNLMRDARAMYNFFNPGTYAKRDTSGAVIKYGMLEEIHDADNLIGVMNTYLKMAGAGYDTKIDDYVKRIYNAEKKGNQQAADAMKEFVTLTKISSNNPAKTLQQKLNKLTKDDQDLSAEEKADYLTENATDKSAYNYVIEQLKAGKLTPEAAREQLKKIYPDKSDDEIWWQVDRNAYEAETGKQLGAKEMYYRLKDAVNENRTEAISKAVKDLVAHGVDKKKIADKMSDWKQEYLSADEKGKIRIRNAVQLVYKELGMTVEEADKRVNSWKPKKEKKD